MRVGKGPLPTMRVSVQRLNSASWMPRHSPRFTRARARSLARVAVAAFPGSSWCCRYYALTGAVDACELFPEISSPDMVSSQTKNKVPLFWATILYKSPGAGKRVTRFA
jgi:hypothetical protein